MQPDLPHLTFSSPQRHATPHTPEGVVVWQWWRLTCLTSAKPQVWQVKQPQAPNMGREGEPPAGRWGAQVSATIFSADIPDIRHCGELAVVRWKSALTSQQPQVLAERTAPVIDSALAPRRRGRVRAWARPAHPVRRHSNSIS
jgi:hypothetical protein